MYIHIYNGICHLCDQNQNTLLMTFPKGSLALDLYNILNGKTLKMVDEFGYVQPGYYRGTDAGSGRTQIRKISDADYLHRVRKNPTMRLLLAIFNPSASTLQTIYHEIQFSFAAGDLLEDNILMYYEDYVDNAVIERRYDYGDGADIQIVDLPSLIGYDLQFLSGYHICQHCKKLYKPKKQEPYCCNTCRCELSRHRSPWNDAQITVKKQIDQEIEMIQDQIYEEGLQTAEKELLKRTLDIYNAAYYDWLDFSAGGNKSVAARTYNQDSWRCDYKAYLRDWWEYFCRVQKMAI